MRKIHFCGTWIKLCKSLKKEKIIIGGVLNGHIGKERHESVRMNGDRGFKNKWNKIILLELLEPYNLSIVNCVIVAKKC